MNSAALSLAAEPPVMPWGQPPDGATRVRVLASKSGKTRGPGNWRSVMWEADDGTKGPYLALADLSLEHIRRTHGPGWYKCQWFKDGPSSILGTSTAFEVLATTRTRPKLAAARRPAAAEEAAPSAPAMTAERLAQVILEAERRAEARAEARAQERIAEVRAAAEAQRQQQQTFFSAMLELQQRFAAPPPPPAPVDMAAQIRAAEQVAELRAELRLRDRLAKLSDRRRRYDDDDDDDDDEPQDGLSALLNNPIVQTAIGSIAARAFAGQDAAALAAPSPSTPTTTTAPASPSAAAPPPPSSAPRARPMPEEDDDDDEEDDDDDEEDRE
jgi:hypothetical protein